MKRIKKEDVWAYKLVRPSNVAGVFTSVITHSPGVGATYRLGYKTFKKDMPIIACEFSAEGHEYISRDLYRSREMRDKKDWFRVLKCKAELWPHPVYRIISPLYLGVVPYQEMIRFWKRQQLGTMVTDYDVLTGEFSNWMFCKWIMPVFDVTDEF